MFKSKSLASDTDIQHKIKAIRELEKQQGIDTNALMSMVDPKTIKTYKEITLMRQERIMTMVKEVRDLGGKFEHAGKIKGPNRSQKRSP